LVNYLAYVEAHGKINEFFKRIIEAQVPPKVTLDFIYTQLGLKSTSFRAMIPLLKKLGFIDDASVPTSVYREYRDPTKSSIVMAQQIKKAYKEIFATNEYAYKLKREEIISKLNTVLGTPSDDKYTPKIAGTFLALCNLADFEKAETTGSMPITVSTGPAMTLESMKSKEQLLGRLGISYTINLDLPATTDIEVFNAIFRALKENLLT
jgi:hypothetical protein